MTSDRSLKVIQTGAIRKLWCSFLFAFHIWHYPVPFAIQRVTSFYYTPPVFSASIHTYIHIHTNKFLTRPARRLRRFCIISEIKRDIGRKSRFFHTPSASDAPFYYGGPRRSTAKRFGTEKLDCCGCPTVKKFDDLFSRFDRIPACDRQTDGYLATA